MVEAIKVLSLKKGDTLQVVLKSDDVDEQILNKVKLGYRQALDIVHGPDVIKLIVMALGSNDDIELSVIRKAK